MFWGFVLNHKSVWFLLFPVFNTLPLNFHRSVFLGLQYTLLKLGPKCHILADFLASFILLKLLSTVAAAIGKIDTILAKVARFGIEEERVEFSIRARVTSLAALLLYLLNISH